MWNQEEAQGGNAEPEPFRTMTKTKIYEMIGREFYLPNKECRCITRTYLIRVHQGTVFRISHQALLNFEVNISPEEKAKSMNFNIGMLRDKASALLELLGQREFGFDRNQNPEEGWFCRILRFIDQFNILNAFRVRVRNGERPLILPVRM